MRWRHLAVRPDGIGYGPDARSLISTPLYSNTTLVCFFPTLSGGGTVHMMGKFDTEKYLKIAEGQRITHTMLVPVQYRRLMEFPDFDKYDLSSFVMKFCTSAPFSAELKAEVLKRCGVADYASFNVLQDDALRQGIKDYSNWPTIPQLYVDGEFVGGCDIVREMYQSGELQQILAPQKA